MKCVKEEAVSEISAYYIDHDFTLGTEPLYENIEVTQATNTFNLLRAPNKMNVCLIFNAEIDHFMSFC